MTRRLDTAPKLWLFTVLGATHHVSALWVDGFVVASEVELHLFSHTVGLEEEVIRFFSNETVRWCQENAESANQSSADLNKISSGRQGKHWKQMLKFRTSAVEVRKVAGNLGCSGWGAMSTQRQ